MSEIFLSICVPMIFLDSYTAETILQSLKRGENEIEISIDLGLSESIIRLAEYKWDISKLRKIVEDPDTVYFINEEGVFKAAIRGKSFYKLMPAGKNKAPALLIDGVLMHRIKDIDPMKDARMKAKLCARKGSEMLEICTGLGYSTIACLDNAVSTITTIERDSDVIELARINPWSQRLFEDERVEMIIGDASEKIKMFSNKRFNGVLHDPPRFTLGPELYTEDFYEELYRVMKPKGVLYHYVGSPGSRYKKKDLPKGIMTRLRKVGFQRVQRKNDTLGVTGFKP
ncbi:MAG: SAM-dependent methyltransferase [Candidatus Lokiarchaeota archaeon]|nr:SAM-dependent methyltransferase [Candidatus Lokiarchaeota archaeon]